MTSFLMLLLNYTRNIPTINHTGGVFIATVSKYMTGYGMGEELERISCGRGNHGKTPK